MLSERRIYVKADGDLQFAPSSDYRKDFIRELNKKNSTEVNPKAGFLATVKNQDGESCISFREFKGRRDDQQDDMTWGELRDFPDEPKLAEQKCEEYIKHINQKITEKFEEKLSREKKTGGATFALLIIDTRDEKCIKLYNPNLGDGTFHTLSGRNDKVDSKLINELDQPGNKHEKARLKELGQATGRIHRAWGERLLGSANGLAVSAGFGDFYAKNSQGQCVIRRTPKIAYRELEVVQVTDEQKTEKPRRLGLLACDGVHEDQGRSVSQVQREINQIVQRNINKPLDESVDKISVNCLERSGDNNSFFLIDFDKIPKGKVVALAISVAYERQVGRLL